MTKTIIAIATSTLILGGCGAQYTSTIQPEPRTSIVDMSESFAKPDNLSLEVCSRLSEYAVTAAQQRQEGLSQDKAQKVVALAAIIRGEPTSVSGKMTGIEMFMTLEQVYSRGLTPANAQHEVFNWCVRENVPLVAYLAATRS